MTKNCPRACLFCEDERCVDRKPRCEKYRSLGYCADNHMYSRFMQKNCEHSCKFCLSPETTTRNEVESYENKEFVCDFETDECDWWNQPLDDTADWLIGVNKHGPVTGFNGSANYTYLDAEYETYYAIMKLPWQLILSDGEKEPGKMCFHFMYQLMNGNRGLGHRGLGAKLSVSQIANPTLENTVTSAVVKFTTTDEKSRWTHAKVDVYVSEHFELRLKGVKGGPKSVVAIDYIFFTRGKC